MSEHHRKTDRIERWIDLPVAAHEVWSVIGPFGELDAWHPGAHGCELVNLEGGVHRHITLGDGALLLEKLEESGERWYRYSLVEGPLPVENYLATLTCFDREEGGCRVFWSASFDSEDPSADDIIAGIFMTGMEALQKRFGG